MSFNDCKISESQIQTTGVQSQADTLTGSAADNKKVFDALPTLVIQKLNDLIDQLQQQAAAGQIGVTPFDGMTAQTLQAALEQIQADIGGNYSGADGAGKVGYTPSKGVDEDTVQEAIEAVQANLAAYINKIKAATGAAEVGNAPIAGMTATNVQHALEELRKNIDNIVSGIIPGGSITSEMIQDGAVTADKLGSDVTGDTIPTSASDPTTISSQLSNKVGNQAKEIPSSNCDNINDLSLYRVHSGTENAFQTGEGGILFSMPWDINRQLQLSANPLGTTLAHRCKNWGIWGSWIPIANATPPQEFSLPLAVGIDAYGKSTYWKTQDGICFVNIAAHPSSASIIDGSIIATLPEGFRPDMDTYAAGHGFTHSGTRIALDVKVIPDGTIKIWTASALEFCSCFVGFVAAS